MSAINTNAASITGYVANSGLILDALTVATDILKDRPHVGTISQDETGYKFVQFEGTILIYLANSDTIIGSFYNSYPNTGLRLDEAYKNQAESLTDCLQDLYEDHIPHKRVSHQEAAEMFDKLWVVADDVVYNPSWANGTGYFDGAVSTDDKIAHPEGNAARFTDDNGRRGIIMWDSFVGSTYVVFERYAPGHGPKVIMFNADMDQGRSSGPVKESSYIAHEMYDYLKLASVIDRLNARTKQH